VITDWPISPDHVITDWPISVITCRVVSKMSLLTSLLTTCEITTHSQQPCTM
ncbi:unnamed protein product, partial [Staurois parvus]